MDKKEQTVTIKPAKGRPMLQWVGKRPINRLTAFPAQTVETFGESPDSGGRLYHGDNKEVLAHLLANGYRGKVDLIYIDPPFDSGADYVRKVKLRGHDQTEMGGEGYTLGEQIQYTDIWTSDNFLQFMYERLQLLKELLSPNGSVYLHCDYRKAHLIRCVLDEVFGADNHLNSLVWMFSTRSAITSSWKRTHHDILFYKKDGAPVFDWDDEMVREPLSDSTIDKYKLVDENGRKYRLSGRNIKGSPIRSAKDVDPEYEKTHPEWVVRDYLRDGKSASDYFFIDIENQASNTRTDYPTQKPEELLVKLISASTPADGLVLDCFIGSGTTAAVAQKLGRRWIGCDINKGAIHITSKRLQGIITEQMSERTQRKKSPELIKDDNAAPEPAQYGFTVHRVNDYDLQIQHNEAVALACEHIGVTRTRSDAFFDGTLGKRLVKIVPFTHPLSPLDMEEVKKELDARPDEQRDIMIVALGKEIAVGKWLDDWNRLRKRGDVPNKIEVVELRTDSKYGKFFAHKPATAKVEIKRLKTKLKIEIKDFISPSIIERLEDQSGVLKPRIDDWRAMVDCIMIDPSYDGAVFNVAFSDIPKKKADLVLGAYSLDPPTEQNTTVAVKIIDMLGEEVLVTQDV